jgi:arsenate reductase (thioredoxin)
METSPNKTRVLFVCVHNSARSQMAEAFLNALAGDRFEAASAGLEPGPLNPLAVEVMKDAGIDISKNQAKSVFELYKSGALFGYVIAVCDAEAAQRCPTFPGITRTLVWSFPDPDAFTGSPEERLTKTRQVRDAIKARIEKFIEAVAAGKAGGLDFSAKKEGGD